MNVNQERNPTLDIMKGIGILLVVLSHSIVKHDPTIVPTFSNGIFNIISSFFMPMLFAISGYLVYNKVGNLDWVKKHTIKWLIPIAIFTIFYWVYNHYFPNIMYFFGLDKLDFVTYSMRMIAYGFGGSVLWFLWSFIICYYIGYLLEQSRLNLHIPFSVQVIYFILIMNIIPFSNFGYFSVKWYGIFFILGYALNYYKINKWYSLIGLLFPLIAYLSNWLKTYQDSTWGNYGVTSLIPSFASGHGGLVVLIFSMAILGTLFVYLVSIMVRWKPMVKVLNYLGVNSIGIYLLHILFIGITSNVWLSFILATLISIGLYEVLKRNSITNFLLFGGDPIKIRFLGGWYVKAKE